MVGINSSLQNAIADGDTRTLTFHHVHTGEDITVTYKKDGRYDENALKKLDWFMRDWRKEQQTHMDPHLFDILWDVYREVGATQPIQVICGYRSPATNAMLRRRSGGVAEFSQHTLGHAMDFYIPGVPLAKVREVGLRLQYGGVGFYPTSGSPFVHLDTGTIRHWPRIARADLQRIFPDGRTVHVPADGKPLRNYALALAEVERQGHVPNTMSLEQARSAGAITVAQEQRAQERQLAQQEEQPAALQHEPGLLARLFGAKKSKAKKSKDEDAGDEAADEAPAPAKIASASVPAAPAPKPIVVTHIVPLPTARPKTIEVAEAEPPAPAKISTAEVDRFKQPGVWRNAFDQPAAAPSVSAAAAAPFELAGIAPPLPTAPTGDALAYAADAPEAPAPKAAPAAAAKPMGARLPRLIPAAMAAEAPTNLTALPKSLAAPLSMGGQQLGSPWMRAVLLTPSVSGFMTMTRTSALDPRWLAELLHKPSETVTMTFSGDPQPGMVASQFSGSAVVFLATTSFGNAKTASLQ